MKICLVLFLYNRPEHTENLLRSLKDADLSSTPIVVYVDGPRNERDVLMQNEIRKILESHTHLLGDDVEIVNQPINLGLRQSIVIGLDRVFKTYDGAIVLEDDLVLERHALRFLREGLLVLRDCPGIGSLSAYRYPSMECGSGGSEDCVAIRRACSWAWATWRDRWSFVDWTIEPFKRVEKNAEFRAAVASLGDDLVRLCRLQLREKISSWAISWNLHHITNNLLCVYPPVNLVANQGFDGSGVHCGKSGKQVVTNLLTEVELGALNWRTDQLDVSCDAQLAAAHRYSVLKRALSRMGF